MAYTFDIGKLPTRPRSATRSIFEMFANRGIYHELVRNATTSTGARAWERNC